MGNRTIERAADFGVATGLRSMTGVALLSRHLEGRPMWQLDSAGERALAAPAARLVLGAAAVGELVADKLPGTPSRLEPRSLVVRAVFGAVGGGVLMHRSRKPALLGAVVGALSAVAGAAIGYHARRELVYRGVPDAAVAVVEDLVAVAVARRSIES